MTADMPPLSPVREQYLVLTALHSAISLMNWDRQVKMPTGGTAARAAQIGRLTAMSHELLLRDELRSAVSEARTQNDGDPIVDRELSLIERQIDQATKIPLNLVASRAEISAQAYDVWRRAKPANDFDALRPYLASLFDIADQISSALGGGEHPYDPLLDQFEEGARTADVEEMFRVIQPRVTRLINRIQMNGVKPDTAWLTAGWDENALRNATSEIAQHIGFDFSRGRLDICANAFCATLSLNDVRMTTRPSNHLKGVLSSSLHELGHALYEQNGNPNWAGTSLAGGASLAVHESQSRMWENIIGRSFEFWSCFLPVLKKHVPSLATSNVDEFYKSYSAISPGWLRVGADELTYNMHIQVRFEIERDIIGGKMQVRDIPEVWNQKMNDYLGVRIESDSQGCLQDVHWSKGSIGYFPTYAMGNLLGGQLWSVMNQEVTDIPNLIQTGNFEPILEWLRSRIYNRASSLSPRQFVESIAGSYLDPEPWLQYSESKYEQIYRLS